MDNGSRALIAILGAGRSTRFGAGKLDAELRGQALGIWPLLTAQQLGDPVVYVTGPEVPRFLRAAVHPAKIITNPDPGRGMGHSVVLAAAAARQAGADRLLLMLGDMPFISTDTLERLRQSTSRDGAAACRYPSGKLGPPACFGADHFSALEQLVGDSGARTLLQENSGTIAVTVKAAELRDIDTMDDLQKLNQPEPDSAD